MYWSMYTDIYWCTYVSIEILIIFDVGLQTSCSNLENLKIGQIRCPVYWEKNTAREEYFAKILWALSAKLFLLVISISHCHSKK